MDVCHPMCSGDRFGSQMLQDMDDYRFLMTIMCEEGEVITRRVQ